MPLPVTLRKFKMSVEKKETKILMGYVNKFDYVDEQEAYVHSGHPFPGRVYRIIQDSSGYRLHIGRENNLAGIDGWVLGKKLKNKLRSYTFDIQLIDFENYTNLTIHPDDVTKMVAWLSNDNQDLYDYLNITTAVAVPTTTPLEQLRQLLMSRQPIGEAASDQHNAVAADNSSDFYTLEIVVIKGEPITITEVESHQFSEADNCLFIKQSSGYLISVPLTNILYTSELA